MAITNEKEGLFEHSQFSGLKNVVPAERFELSDLATAKNVDIDDSLEISRRYGYDAPSLAGDVHSLFAYGGVCLAVLNNTNLIRINPDFSYVTLKSDLVSGRVISYSPIPGHGIGWSNGIQIGIVDAQTLLDRSWGIEPPSVQGNAATAGGTMRSGTYQYAVTFIRMDGQESGTPHAGTFEVTEGGFNLTDLPVSDDPDVTGKAIWVTDTNAEHLYRHGTVDNSVTTYSVVAPVKQTVRLNTQFLRNPIAGQIVRVFNARSLIAVNDSLMYSEPYAYELFDWRKNFRVGGAYTLVEPMHDGVYLATAEGIFWASGDIPEKWQLVEKFSYGAIPETSARCSVDMLFEGKGSGPAVVFASTQGICVGTSGGQIVNITQNQYQYPVSARGAGLIRRHKGTVQYLAALRD